MGQERESTDGVYNEEHDNQGCHDLNEHETNSCGWILVILVHGSSRKEEEELHEPNMKQKNASSGASQLSFPLIPLVYFCSAT